MTLPDALLDAIYAEAMPDEEHAFFVDIFGDEQAVRREIARRFAEAMLKVARDEMLVIVSDS